MSTLARDSDLAEKAPGPPGLPGLMSAEEPPTGQEAPAKTSQKIHSRIASLSVVIPARDEAQNLAPLMADLLGVLGLQKEQGFLIYEILVIDDGSRDDTPVIAKALGARVISHPHSLGNGAAVKRGIREAKMDWILLLDGDGQHPAEAIPAMLEMAERYDMVVGSRGGAQGAFHRNLANKIYNGLASYVTGTKIPDLTSGFRLMRADVVKGFVYLLPNTFSYPTTITLAMMRVGYPVAFLPIELRPRQGKSHIRIIKDGSRFFLIILRIATFFAPLRVFLPISALMFALGLGWYLYTYVTGQRFTNMAVLLFTQATVIFVLGLISEQVAALRFQGSEGDRSR